MIIYGSLGKSKKYKSSRSKREEYQRWLQKHQSGMKPVEKFVPLTNYNLTNRQTRQIPSNNDGFGDSTLTKTGIMRDYHKMSASDRAIIDNVATQVAPIHKSCYVFISPGMNPASFGRKNEVL